MAPPPPKTISRNSVNISDLPGNRSHNRGMDPPQYGKMSSKALKFVARLILPEPEFEFLLYCDDGHWKLKEWCRLSYSLWTHNCKIWPPPVKKETAHNALNNTTLIRMDTPSHSNTILISEKESPDLNTQLERYANVYHITMTNIAITLQPVHSKMTTMARSKMGHTMVLPLMEEIKICKKLRLIP